MQLAQAIDAWSDAHQASLSASTRRDIGAIRDAVVEIGRGDLPHRAVDAGARQEIIAAATESCHLSERAIGEFLSVVLEWATAQAPPQPRDPAAAPRGAFQTHIAKDDDEFEDWGIDDPEDDEDWDEDDLDDEEADDDLDDDEDWDDDDDDDSDDDQDWDDEEDDDDWDDEEDPNDDDDEDWDDDLDDDWDDEEDPDADDDDDLEDDDSDDDQDWDDEEDDDLDDLHDDEEWEDDADDTEGALADFEDELEEIALGTGDLSDDHDWVGYLAGAEDDTAVLPPENEPAVAPADRAAASSFFQAIESSPAPGEPPVAVSAEPSASTPAGGAFSAASEGGGKASRGSIDWITVAYFSVAAICFALVIYFYVTSR